MQLGYGVKLDQLAEASWNALLQGFDDSSLYQTWVHGAKRHGEGALSHLVLERDGTPVAAAQVVVKALPVLRAGIAYVKSGPLWRRSGESLDFDVYARMLRELRREYAERRRLLLRLKPWESEDEERCAAIREAEGFLRQPGEEPYKTFVLDLAHELDDIHAGLPRKWRRDLRRARDLGLKAERVEGLEGIDAFVELYKTMHARKRFADFMSIDRLRSLYADLPDGVKPWVTLCRHEGEVLAGVVCSAMGNTALAIFGATSARGLRLGASFVVNWEVLERLKCERRCRWYDLVGGLDNPGIRHFKTGLAKGCGREIHMPDFVAPAHGLSRYAVGLATSVRGVVRRARREVGL